MIRSLGQSLAGLPVCMCPQTENEDGRLDSIDPATFVRNMSSKALAA